METPSLSPKIVHLVAAARPNFMKVAPLYHQLAREGWCAARIVHTGQHYDANMSDAFFRDLGLPEPAHHLEVAAARMPNRPGGPCSPMRRAAGAAGALGWTDRACAAASLRRLISLTR
jgi:UDP-N-acetylglucosamine 2-epimerase